MFIVNRFHLFIFLFSTLLMSPAIAKEQYLNCSEPRKSSGQWTESDWINWWTNIENLYLDGLPSDGLYWLVRHDIELLQQSVDILNDVDFPTLPPPSGSPVDPNMPTMPQKSLAFSFYSNRYNDCTLMKYADYPDQWHELFENYGIETPGWTRIPAPPVWLSASIALFGTQLTRSLDPRVRVAGYAIADVGALMIIWAELEEE